jgi:hypothetical protein
MSIIDEIRDNRDMLDQHHMYERLIGNMSDRIGELEALLDVTNHALEFALKRLEKISAERVKEIEAHRQTTLKLIALQEKQR